MKKLSIILGAAALTAVSAVQSFAATLDFSGMTTAVTAEISPAITAAMPIAGLVLAAGLGIKLYKRFVK